MIVLCGVNKGLVWMQRVRERPSYKLTALNNSILESDNYISIQPNNSTLVISL